MELEPRMVVLLDPVKTANPNFAGMLAIISEVKDWGIICCVPTFKGHAYYRAENGTFTPLLDGKVPADIIQGLK